MVIQLKNSLKSPQSKKYGTLFGAVTLFGEAWNAQEFFTQMHDGANDRCKLLYFDGS
jgi:hypothetical protein